MISSIQTYCDLLITKFASISTERSYCDLLITKFASISTERIDVLNKISEYINNKKKENKPINLVYICTHNSRRSHFGQVWAHVAANYYKVNDINTFSGGTETTAFNINAINTLKRIGFDIKPINTKKNSTYHLYFDKDEKPIVCFSKLYDDAKNPSKVFAAIMTCSDAEVNCPYISGVELRIGSAYNDPKEFDNTSFKNNKYDECCKQIAMETFYVFSQIK